VFSEFFSVFPQYLIPKQALTIFAGKVANAEAGPITTLIIRWFIRRYGVNMEEAAERDVHHYRTFNEFFTRALAPGKRFISKADYVCPADGFISQVGVIGGNQILQAKGTTTPPWLWWEGTRNSPISFTTVISRRYISVPAIITASTCRALAD
jgi:phosphatidylserine decarboxylase